MVLVMILLQIVEPPSRMLACVDKMQWVVHQIVSYITETEANPEEGEQNRIVNPDDLDGQREKNTQFDSQQNWRMH